MALRFQKWPILEFLGVTKEDYEIYRELNSLLYTYAVRKKFYPTKKEVLSNFSEAERERAGFVLDAFADVQLIERRYLEMRDNDGEYNRNTPCYSLYTAAELEEIHGWCDANSEETAPKELLTDD